MEHVYGGETPETGFSDTTEPSKSSGSLEQMASKAGIDPNLIGSLRDRFKSVDVTKVREYARANPGKALGILSALVIGGGLLASSMRGRR